MNNSAIYIYALIDPRDGEVRYIGKSCRPRERLMNHCNEHSRTWRVHWIQQLVSLGLRPTLAILETLPCDADWQTTERRWIAMGKERGWKLTNGTSGGDGVSDLSPEVRARMRLTWLGRKHRPDSLLKIGIASKGRVRSAESIAHMRRIMTGRHITWNDKVRHAMEKLTADQVRAIRTAIATGERQRSIGARFGVDSGTISNIHRGKCYQWVSA